MKRPIDSSSNGEAIKKQKTSENDNQEKAYDSFKDFLNKRNEHEAEAEKMLSLEQFEQKVKLEKTQTVVLSGFDEKEYPTGTFYLPDKQCGASGPRNMLQDCGLRTWSWYLNIRKGNIKDVRVGARALKKYPKDVLADYKDFLEFDGSTEMFRFDFLTGEPVYVALDLKEYVVTLI